MTNPWKYDHTMMLVLFVSLGLCVQHVLILSGNHLEELTEELFKVRFFRESITFRCYKRESEDFLGHGKVVTYIVRSIMTNPWKYDCTMMLVLFVSQSGSVCTVFPLKATNSTLL